MRRGGASSDFLLKRRPLNEIQLRGRLAAESSLLRYQKSAVAQREVLKLPAGAPEAAAVINANLSRIFDKLDYAKDAISGLLK